MRETFVRPLGLIRQPNRFGVYPAGAMSEAQGLVTRAPGEMAPFPERSQYAPAVAGTADEYAAHIFPTGDQFLVVTQEGASTRVYYATAGAQVAGALPEGADQVVSRIRAVQFRDRTLLPLSAGLAVWDTPNPSTLAERTARWAQLPQPQIEGFGFPSNGAESLGPHKVVGYAVILRRVYADGYELVSAPSPIQAIRNDSSTTPTSVSVRVTFPVDQPTGRANVVAGDIVELYRTREISAPTTGLGVNPGTTLFLVKTHTLTSSDVSDGTVISTPSPRGVYDTAQADKVVGRELYTNPGQETLQSARFAPPIAKCIGTFKGYTLYGNITEPGAFVAAFPGGLGMLATAATRTGGIGARRLTGTFTSGSPTVTGVSAADIVGIKPGQLVYFAGAFPANLWPNSTITVVSVGVSSVTFNTNANVSGSVQVTIADAIEIDGVVYNFADFQTLIDSMADRRSALQSDEYYTIVADEPIAYKEVLAGIDPGTTYGQRIQLTPFRATQNNNSITVRATNGANYNPPVPEITASVTTFSPKDQPNLLAWSWEQQPEAVGPGTYAFIGNGDIDAIATTRDVAWLWKQDGLWRFTGYGTRPSGIQSNFRVDLVDRTIRLAGPQAWCVLRDACFGWTNIGLVRVDDANGITALSRGVIGDLLPGLQFAETVSLQLAAHEDLDEIWITRVTGDVFAGTGVSTTIVWSEQYQQFTELRQNIGPTEILTQAVFSRQTGTMMQLVSMDGSTSGRIDWHDPAQTVEMAARGVFQPVYGQNPAEIKQWVDMQLVFDLASAGKSVTGIIGTQETAAPLIAYSGDARAEYGVGFDVPAVGHVIAPGFAFAAGTEPMKFRFLSLRFEFLTEEGQVRT